MTSAADFAAQSDPHRNRHFPRRWTEPLDDLSEPCRLDRLADRELQVGRAAQAERLSHAAAELRGDPA